MTLKIRRRSGVSRTTRRQFLQAGIAAGTALCGAPAFLRGRNLNDKLNIACIGVGGRGASNLAGVASENIVALCDVSQNAVDKAATKYLKRPQVFGLPPRVRPCA